MLEQCPFLPECMITERERCKSYTSCGLYEFRVHQERELEKDRELIRSLETHLDIPFHSYEPTAQINPEGRR